MILQIKDNAGKELGTLILEPLDIFRFEGSFDKHFAEFLQNSLDSGITQVKDIHDPKSHESTIIESPIKKEDPNYFLAIKDFLKRAGYIVTEKHPEALEEIKKLLEGFPDDNPDKIDILKRLPEMSYLEQTFILEALKGYKE